ncbi:BatD family protein [Solidesulfovibrio magneticus]|uniref:Uncharacterized protein n=1 Tax=Solidesulfovibrio magneticus (strain ATCC 700980 / DSM 13731 / RS-1) TaxID=573370 RepID=C4XL65_SOLM1|nr:BatD family protein [Solidesulfovibrio magneticus]BAH77006.1 hypothetical protein DMR_35150 [Solidesulfovibrio magneticus RS-1]
MRRAFGLAVRLPAALVLAVVLALFGSAMAQVPPGPAAPAVAPPGLAGKTVFLDATLTPPNPWLGQTAVYALTLYRSVAASGLSVTPPPFEGFDAAPLPGQDDGQLTAGGKRYVVSRVAYALTPKRAGRLPLGPPQARLVGLPGTSAPLTVAGPALAAEVRPLPPPPDGFPDSGLVGRLELTAALAPAALAVGEETRLTVTLTGRGNLAGAALPPLAVPPGLLLRALGNEDALTPGPDGAAGRRVFHYGLMAAAPDRYTLPSLAVAVFDPAAGTWSVAAGPELVLIVAPAPGSPQADDAPASPGRRAEAGDVADEPAGWRRLLPNLAPRVAVAAATPLACAPEAGAEILFVLPPGRRVALGPARNGFVRLETDDDVVGWVRRDTIVTILP